MRPLALCILLLAAGCGAEGPPIAPERPSGALTISGTAQIGIVMRDE